MALDHPISVSKYLRTLAIFMSVLVISLPAVFASTQNLVWNANGNLISGDGFFRVYNSFNQLWKIYEGDDENGVLRFEFTHHPTEERVLIKKVYNESGSLTETVYYVNKNLVRTVDASGTRDTTYIYHEGQLIAERQDDGTKLFYHPDMLGSTSLVTDNNGDLVEETFYTPFGVILSGGTQSRYDYEAKEYDSIINQYDFHFRGYKADWGIFTQPDTLIQDVYNPQTLNRYSFEHNNPYNRVDPDGHIGIVGIAAIYIAVRTAIGIVQAVSSGYHSDMGFKEVANLAGKGALKGFTIGVTEVAIVSVGVLSGGTVVGGLLGVGTALLVGEEIMEPAWKIEDGNKEPTMKGPEDCKGPLCKKDTIPEIKPPQPQEAGDGSSSTSGSGIVSSGSTRGSTGGGTGGGGCVPDCHTGCHTTHDGKVECHTVCSVCP